MACIAAPWSLRAKEASRRRACPAAGMIYDISSSADVVGLSDIRHSSVTKGVGGQDSWAQNDMDDEDSLVRNGIRGRVLRAEAAVDSPHASPTRVFRGLRLKLGTGLRWHA